MDGLTRTQGCPRGHVYGCPIRGTECRDTRLPILLSYYSYFDKGFTWEEFLAEPAFVREAMLTMKGSIARREERMMAKNKAEMEKTKASSVETKLPRGGRFKK